MGFKAFQFCDEISESIKAQGFVKPTPIQEKAIPIVMKGRDVVGLAQTGTGKTAAFVLPILERLNQGQRGKVRALIIAPTRELAGQINDVVVSLGKSIGIKSMTIFGGVNINPQMKNLRSGVDVVVACPGRLLDHMNQKTIVLSHLEVLVLDEADQMFDMGFLPDIRKILKQVPKKRQTLLFSATMPKEIQFLAQECLTNPETIETAKNAAAVTVTHALFPVSQHLKTELLLQIMYKIGTGSVLVFTRTKHRAKRLAETLVSADFRAASLQGNLSQAKREKALAGFRDGTFQVLVATDIAARGIDVSQISHVINYDIPDTTDAYIHRIGRTGRAARTGDAYTFVTAEDSGAVRAIERVLKASIERRTVEGFDYKAAESKKNEFARPSRPGQSSNRKPSGAGSTRDGRSFSAGGFRRKKS
ncbi:MAG: DEAD/DEAH box helicase [Spirochaetia bacterium]|nr:DEAD/DEAH box helicase [Spirochaetia bacterium]